MPIPRPLPPIPRRRKTPAPNRSPSTSFEACFDNLANAAKAEHTTLNKLVKSIAVLTATNSKLVAAGGKWGEENTTLQHEINALRKRGGNSRLTSIKNKGRRSCKNCGVKVHNHAGCLELPQNAKKREAVWESKL